jgi:hypothetical protein
MRPAAALIFCLTFLPTTFVKADDKAAPSESAVPSETDAEKARNMLNLALAALETKDLNSLKAQLNDDNDSTFHDGELYVFCFSTLDNDRTLIAGQNIGKDVTTLRSGSREWGKELFQLAKDGSEKKLYELCYMAPKKGGGTDLYPKHTVVSRVGNIGCGVGYYGPPCPGR